MEKITAETLVRKSELAVVLGLTARRVQQMVEDGVLQSEDGKMNLSKSVQAYVKFTNKDTRTEEDAKLEKTKLVAEAQIKASKATMVKLEADELRGKMHRSEDVEAITQDMVYAIRGALIALPGRLAVDTANAKTAAETAEIIRKEVHTVMNELANYQYDPSKYEERVRNRKEWDSNIEDDDE